ncbi:MAG: hypothetical protein EYX74_05115 [Desulfobulbaceae bacterium]|nr:MAG: hypothetical protein EYX74_05115 [Desulfobulbaceae bacterium]
MDFFATLIELFGKTRIPTQVSEVDIRGLFTNPWFLIPFITWVSYKLYRQAVTALALTALVVTLWIFSGSPMMDGLIINGELQPGKILLVAGVGLVAVIIAVYFLFVRPK